MLVSLYTVRVVLNVLGEEDYGIYNVVAGVVTMFGFLSGAMATASQRYFAFDLGKHDYEHLKTTFSVTFQIYMLLAVIIVILAETVGLWFVMNKLVIPLERLTAAIWIYQAAVVSFLLTLIATPYMASIIAHENMNIYAYVSIVEAVLKLGIVFILQVLDYDKLLLYALLLTTVGMITTAIYRLYCKRNYNECKFRYTKDKTLFKELVSYSGWNLFGASIGIAKNQLVDVSINLFCGPNVNAARAVASQIYNAVNSFVSNFSTALSPNIIKLYAVSQKQVYINSTFQSIRFVFLLISFIALPLIFEMPNILEIWLAVVPEHTIDFAKLVLIDAIICSIFYPLGSAVQATGEIKQYQIIVSIVLLCNFPFSYILLYCGYSPECTFYTAIILSTISVIIRLIITRKIIGFSFVDKVFYLNFIKIMLYISITVFGLWIVNYLLPDLHFLLRMLYEYAVCALGVYFLGIRKCEIEKVKEIIKQKYNG